MQSGFVTLLNANLTLPYITSVNSGVNRDTINATNLVRGIFGMKTFVQRTTATTELEDVRCNLCGRDVEKNHIGYFEDHISITKMWGYHSPFDGEEHEVDFCVDCYRGLTAQFAIPPQVS